MNSVSQTSGVAVLLFLTLLLPTVPVIAATPSGPIHQYEPKPYSNLRYPQLDQVPDEPTVADAVDERPLWRLLRDRQYVELSAELERYRHWYPAWQPPVDLLTSLALGELSAGVKSRKDQHAWQELITLAEQHPEDFSCAKIHNRWALGEAYFATGQGYALQTLYEKILSECPDPEQRLVTLQQAGQRLPYAVTAEFLQREQEKDLTPAARTALEDVEYRFHAGWLAIAMQRNAVPEADRAAAFLQNGIVVRRDAGTASLLGWWALRKGRDMQAVDWFKQALSWRHDRELAYGLALAWRHAKRLDQVRILADNWHEEPRIARLLSDPGRSPIVLAYAQGHYQRSLHLAEAALRRVDKQHPRQRQALQLLKAWSLLKLNAAGKAADQFAALYNDMPNKESARGLVLSSQRLGDFERPQNLARRRGGPLAVLLQPTAPAARPGATLYYDYYRQWLATRVKARSFSAAVELVPRLAQRIVARRDARTALLAAWANYNTGANQAAEQWFAQALAWQPSADAAHGLAMTRRAAGDWAGAEQVARRWGRRYPQTQSVGRDALLDRGLAAYSLKHYHESLDYAQKSRQYGASRRGDLLGAWSRFGLGEHGAAAAEFARLYTTQPDDESANGWLTAGLANDQEVELRKAATAEPDSPLHKRLRDHDADDYFGRDLFVLANANRVNARPGLAQVDSPSLAWLPFARHRSGISGLGQLDMYGVSTQARWGRGLHRFGFDVDMIWLDAGALATGAQVGSLGTPITTTTLSEDSLVVPQLSYQYAGALGPYLSIGSTPLGGAVGGVPVATLGLRYRGRNRFWDINLFAQNIQQSILSTSGLIDATTGRAWGRVVERGGRGRIWQALNSRWSVTASGTLAQIVGHEVADNLHLGGRFGLGYALAVPGFDYFTVGPAYGFEHYSDNRRFFTYGHGGYFSPEQFHKAGVELNMQTTDGQPFVLRAYTALSYQHTDEANARAFPLTDSGPLLFGGTTDGIAFDTNITGVYRLGPQVQIGGFFDVVQSPNFTDIGGGLMLRLFLEPRPAAVSTDLPGRPWLP
jgi:hypothetical protein